MEIRSRSFGIRTEILETEEIPYEGFVISDNQFNPKIFFGKTVYYLSELDSDVNKTGLVLALPAHVQSVVKAICVERGYRNIFTYPIKIANI